MAGSCRYFEEAKLFYDYLKQTYVPGEKLHANVLRRCHAEWWRTTLLPNCKSWRPLHETMKKHKALKQSGRGGYFKLSSEWPATAGDLLPSVDQQSYREPEEPIQRTNGGLVAQSILQLFRQNRYVVHATGAPFGGSLFLHLVHSVACRSALLLDKHGVEIHSINQDSTGRSINFEVVQDKARSPTERASATAQIEIINKSIQPVKFRSCGFLRNDRAFTLYDHRHVSDGLCHVISTHGQRYEVLCCFQPQGLGVHSDIVAFIFAITDARGREEIFHIVRYVKGRCTTTMAKEIRSKEKYQPKWVKRSTVRRSIETGESLKG